MLTTGLLSLCSFIDQELSFLVYIGDVFLKSLLIILLLSYVSKSMENLASSNKHLMWLSGFSCLVLIPFLPVLFESVFAETILASSLKIMTLTVPVAYGEAQVTSIAQGFDWQNFFLLAYLLILLFLLLRLLVSISRVACIGNSSEYLRCGESFELLQSLRGKLSISRKVNLGLSESIHSPVSSGLAAPIILLPITALD